MEYVIVILVAAAIFGLCYLVDRSFTKLFRSKAQHMSGLAIRASKRYGSFGLILVVLGISAAFASVENGWLLLIGGIIVGLIGLGLVTHYLTFGIFYDEESFLVSKFGRKSVAYRYDQIKGQMLYISGSSVLIELHMTDGKAVMLQSGMEGVYAFLDKAFAGWCRQKGIDPESCEFHDPANSLWFPQE